MLLRYIDWHYFEVWPKILLWTRNLALFPFYYFNIPLHLTSLLSPWKRQTIRKKPGVNLENIANVIAFNIISRSVGAGIRLATIFYGLIFMIILAAIGIFISLSWIFIPGITLPLYIIVLRKRQPEFISLLKYKEGNLKIGIEKLLRAPAGRFILWHLGILPESVISVIDKNCDIDMALIKKYLETDDKYSIAHLYSAIFQSSDILRNLLTEYKLDSDMVYQTAGWFELLQKKDNTHLLSNLEKIKKLPGIGLDWNYGYTVEFDKYSQDLTHHVSAFPRLFGREHEIGDLERVLVKTEGNNILLVGKPGVARHLLVETLAHRIMTGNCPAALSHRRVLSIYMHSLIAARPSLLEAKGLVADLMAEATTAGNIIVVIDEIDKYLSNENGKIDLTDIFVSLAESSIGFIGITTPESYHRYLENNSRLSVLFEKIEITEPDKPTVLTQLQISIVPVLENKHKCIITLQSLINAIEDADRYINLTPFPGKAIDLIEEAIIEMKLDQNRNVLRPEDIDKIIEKKYKIPVGEISKSEKDKLVNLPELLHKRIVNQEQAIQALSASLRRARLNISSPNKPIGSFLFLGPTGVGKTETAKALTEVYFGSNERILRFDMSQYQKEEGIERLIGSIKLGTPGELTAKLIDNPSSLLLFDEFEKSDPKIYNLFLTLMDEGYITDATARKINAKNTLIIATSNAGAEFIREKIKEGVSGLELQQELIEYIQTKMIFSPELLNRFDGVIVFTPLSEGNLREVAKLLLIDLNNRLSSQNISIDINPLLVKKLALAGFDQIFGARKMKRIIAEKIEDQIAQKLLSGNIKKGEVISIDI